MSIIDLEHFWKQTVLKRSMLGTPSSILTPRGSISGGKSLRNPTEIYPHTTRPGGMRGAIESAAPKRRPGLALQTPAELAGVFRHPPWPGPAHSAGRPPDYHPTTTRLHPTDPFGALGRSWAALGALLLRSWTIAAA